MKNEKDTFEKADNLPGSKLLSWLVKQHLISAGSGTTLLRRIIENFLVNLNKQEIEGPSQTVGRSKRLEGTVEGTKNTYDHEK